MRAGTIALEDALGPLSWPRVEPTDRICLLLASLKRALPRLHLQSIFAFLQDLGSPVIGSLQLGRRLLGRLGDGALRFDSYQVDVILELVFAPDRDRLAGRQ